MTQNEAARLVFNKPKRVPVTPLFISPHWLLVAACISFNPLILAYRTAASYTYPISSLSLFYESNALQKPEVGERHLAVPSKRGTKSLSRIFSFTVSYCWNDLPNTIPTAKSQTIFKKRLKTHLFCKHLTAFCIQKSINSCHYFLVPLCSSL